MIARDRWLFIDAHCPESAAAFKTRYLEIFERNLQNAVSECTRNTKVAHQSPEVESLTSRFAQLKLLRQPHDNHERLQFDQALRLCIIEPITRRIIAETDFGEAFFGKPLEFYLRGTGSLKVYLLLHLQRWLLHNLPRVYQIDTLVRAHLAMQEFSQPMAALIEERLRYCVQKILAAIASKPDHQCVRAPFDCIVERVVAGKTVRQLAYSRRVPGIERLLPGCRARRVRYRTPTQ